MKYVSALQNSHHNMSVFVGDIVQVPHCYSAELVILLRRNLVSVQCVTTRSIPSSPCVVFSIAFACSEFNLRSACRKKKHLSFLEQGWPIFQSFPPGIHTFVYTAKFSVVFHAFWTHCLEMNT